MRMGPKLVTGIAATVLAVSACGAIAGTSSGTPGSHRTPLQAGYAGSDTRFADMRQLAQLKRDAMLAQLKRDAMCNTVEGSGCDSRGWTVHDSPGKANSPRVKWGHGGP
jgi:hypothetical protein